MNQSVLTAVACFAVCCVAFGQAPTPPGSDRITRTTIAAECLRLHGEDVLNRLVKETIIRQECERQGIVITEEEIDAKIHRLAWMSPERWIQILREEHNVSPEQYRNDIIRWFLAFEKLAGSRLTVNEAELMEAYNTPPVVAIANQITLATRTEAEAVLAEVKQYPETFTAVARNKSIATRLGGTIRHTEDPNVNKILSAMKPGDISPVVEYPPGQFTIFQHELKLLPPARISFDAVKEQLSDAILEKKRSQINAEIFTELRNAAQVKIIFGNPTLYNQYPGVAAIVNGQEISMKELTDRCHQKHGEDVLNDMTNRLWQSEANFAPKVRCLETWRQNRLVRNRPFRTVRTDTAYTPPPAPTTAAQAMPPESVSIERTAESTKEIKLSRVFTQI